MFEYWIHIAPLGTFLATLTWFVIGMPTVFAAYYQSWKARQEARAAREGALHEMNCLEFVSVEGECVNLVPLDTLHTLPKPGDIVLLPGHGVSEGAKFFPGAFRVESIEHIYSPVQNKSTRPYQAGLVKAVAQVTSLNAATNEA
ncbi:MAG: hypothetical protein WBQ94_27285 [Terracidiphilus sp.]